MKKTLPASGLTKTEIYQQWDNYTKDDMLWKEGKFFGYVYYPGDEYYSVIKEAYAKFSATNALNPAVFPSLKNMENEVVQITASFLHGDESVSGNDFRRHRKYFYGCESSERMGQTTQTNEEPTDIAGRNLSRILQSCRHDGI